MRKWLIEKLGGYPDIDSAIEAIRDKNLEEKYTILTLAVKKLFNTIGPDDILKQTKRGEWMYRGKLLSESDKNLLMAEAMQLSEMKLWGVLQDDVKWQANRKMFILGKTSEDLTAGKLWQYTLDALNTRIKSLIGGSGMFNNSEEGRS